MHRFRLGDLLGLEPLAVEHVEKIRISADVELVGPVHGACSVLEELGQSPVNNGGPNLGFYVISHDRDASS